MKLKLTWVVGMIVITNLLTFAFVKLYFPTTIDNTQYLLKMSGQGEEWEITDYQLAWQGVGEQGTSGSHSVTFLGETSGLNGEVEVKVYDFFEDGEKPHHVSTFNADILEDGPAKQGGGGFYPEKHLTPSEIENRTFMVIQWTTIDGKQHVETIQMELDYDPQIISDIQ
ncbi:hypothetical protein LGQ02_02790 [Bacillus shivajii]|uniref:hypothetical protein n=1 Tax=Bacillus shivajii TaxID=1983719 RepID=UPI001CFAA22E|nr:hypothetical protein [Bacillus shivajii]UCZ51470.1 hypothetical protein LGQ02_11335 [Bacillus shivajii]UCZ53731.1 hypothetical protein LGQ02_02790 [Bacillus shivajii]